MCGQSFIVIKFSSSSNPAWELVKAWLDYLDGFLSEKSVQKMKKQSRKSDYFPGAGINPLDKTRAEMCPEMHTTTKMAKPSKFWEEQVTKKISEERSRLLWISQTSDNSLSRVEREDKESNPGGAKCRCGNQCANQGYRKEESIMAAKKNMIDVTAIYERAQLMRLLQKSSMMTQLFLWQQKYKWIMSSPTQSGL